MMWVRVRVSRVVVRHLAHGVAQPLGQRRLRLLDRQPRGAPPAPAPAPAPAAAPLRLKMGRSATVGLIMLMRCACAPSRTPAPTRPPCTRAAAAPPAPPAPRAYPPQHLNPQHYITLTLTLTLPALF
jgi:hypothetical protein